MCKLRSIYCVIAFFVVCVCNLHSAEYTASKHRKPKAHEIPISKPGSYDQAGAHYILTNDISSACTPIFLGNNVTLDLNGYTISYANANYQHIKNFDFTDGLAHWDISQAAQATVKNTSMSHPMIGDNSLFLPKNQEIVSPYVELPVANRSYYAMVAASKQGKYLSIHVEDASGNEVNCAFNFGSQTRISCPERKRGPKLGGGIVFAHIHGLAAGKYRMRVKALSDDVVIGAIDLVPAMDVGIGIVEKTLPWAYYKCILDGDGCAFFDYTKKGSTHEPKQGIPTVLSQGAIHVKNGIIKSGPVGIRSWGIQSTASNTAIHIENVKFESLGTNANAISVPFGSLKQSHISVETPFIIDRHRRDACAVSFYSKRQPSEVAHNTFIGGQGCLHIAGPKSIVQNNSFKNKQTVTNHYSISCDGEGSKVFNNSFDPELGSGIYIFRQKNIEIYNNTFKIRSSPPNNEYSQSDYSTNAIRISDYNTKPGSKRGWCENNKVYNNTFTITSQDYPLASDKYISLAYGIFMSVGGGQNYIYNNTFTLKNNNLGSKRSNIFGIYIGGSHQGGIYTNNNFTSNSSPVWISNRYGVGYNATFIKNTFTKANNAKTFLPFILGHYKHPSKNIHFISNEFNNLRFDVQINDYSSNYTSAYAVGWTLDIDAPANSTVNIRNEINGTTQTDTANADGKLSVHLLEYQAVGKKITDISKYTISVNGKQKTISLRNDSSISF